MYKVGVKMGCTSRDLKKYQLQEFNLSKSSKTGAVKQGNSNWVPIDTIEVAVYKRRTTVLVNKIRQVQTRYQGLTKYKNIQAVKNRLVGEDNTVYYVADVTPGLWYNLDLSTDKVE